MIARDLNTLSVTWGEELKNSASRWVQVQSGRKAACSALHAMNCSQPGNTGRGFIYEAKSHQKARLTSGSVCAVPRGAERNLRDLCQETSPYYRDLVPFVIGLPWLCLLSKVSGRKHKPVQFPNRKNVINQLLLAFFNIRWGIFPRPDGATLRNVGNEPPKCRAIQDWYSDCSCGEWRSTPSFCSKCNEAIR
jgi:hypothetical protein